MKKPGLRCLTVHQPYASLIAYGLKAIEIRPKRTHHRGELAILAGVTWSQHGGLSPAVRAAWTAWSAANGLPGVVCQGAPGLEAGGIVAVVDAVGCHEATPLTRSDGTQGVCCEPWADPVYGGWHWELGNPRAVRRLVFCQGSQGIAILSRTLEDRVRAEL